MNVAAGIAKGGWWGAGIAIVGGWLAARLIPEAKPRKDRGSPPTLDSANALGAYNKLPRAYGTNRIYPQMAAQPWVETVGDTYYYVLLYTLGYGRLTPSAGSLKFGDIDLDAYHNVTYEFREGYAGEAARTIFPPMVRSQEMDLFVPNWVPPDGAWASVGTTEPESDAFYLELTYTDGLGLLVDYRIPIPGGGHGPTVRTWMLLMEKWEVQVSRADVGSWHTVEPRDPLPNDGLVYGKAGQVRVLGSVYEIPESVVWESGLYDIRIRKRVHQHDPDYTSETATIIEEHEELRVTELRCVHKVDPIAIDKGANPVYVSTIGVRIPCDEGADIYSFNCVAQSVLYSTITSTWAATNNPAWAWLDVLTGSANILAVDLATRINTTALESWANHCDDAGWDFCAMFDQEHTVSEALSLITSCARATWTPCDATGKYAVIEEREVDFTNAAHITPKNSWGFVQHKLFPPALHGYRVEYVDENAGYIDAEHTVYADGYTAANSTIFERISCWGAHTYQQADDFGRYRLGERTYRPETFEVWQDFENLVCTRCDPVYLAHDVSKIGLAQGRVKAALEESLIGDSPGDFIGVVVDEPCTMESGTDYGVMIRYKNGTWVRKAVKTEAGPQTTLLFTEPIPAATDPHPEAQNLFMFGPYGQEATPCLVAQIDPGPELTAKLTLVPYDVRVYNYGNAGEYNPIVVRPPDISRQPPIAPVIYGVQTNEDVMQRGPDGSLVSRIVLTLIHGVMSNSSGVPLGSTAAAWVEVDYRPSNTDTWVSAGRFSGPAQTVWVSDVNDGWTYDVRVRAVSEHYVASAWVESDGILVIGKTSAPADPEELALEADVLRWSYDDYPIDFAGFEIRQHRGTDPSWDNATKIHQGLIGTTYHVLPHMQGGAMTFYVKAVDTSGNESDNAAYLAVTLSDQVLQNIDSTYSLDFPALGWLAYGTLVGGTVDGSNHMIADVDVGALMWTDDGAPMWTGDANPMWGETTYKEMTYTTDWCSLSAGIDDPERYVSTPMTVTAGSLKIEYKYWDIANPIDPETMPWIPWPGTIRDTGKQYQLKVTTSAGATQGVVSALALQTWYPDKQETVLAHTCPAAPTQIPLTETFTTIQAVLVAITGTTARSYQVTDMSPATGPKVQLRDAAGDPCQDTANVFVKGYEAIP